jgi:nitric oxide reductase subunit C
VVAAWGKRPDTLDQGEVRFRQMFCSTCHSLAVMRAGETTLIGGDIGPELTKVGNKVNPDWLAAWLRNPQAYLPHSQMPRYGWTDEDLYKVAQYIQTKLNDPSLLSGIPQLGPATPQESAAGKKLFVQKGCSSCHAIQGVNTPSDFGPDLSSLGMKTTSQLEFGQAKVPHTLVSYIQTKITDPLSVNQAARMPQYHLKTGTLEALTTALLSMTGGPATPAMGKLVVPASRPSFRPAGTFGALFERFKCSVCHSFNGFGGRLAPDLSFEGSRAQRAWLIAFMKNPQTLRPTLTLRMPQFNMTDQEATTIADYLAMALQSPQVNSDVAGRKIFTPQMAALGKQLYEVKYQCRSCHTIGSAGGYVGPNLSNVGNWMKPEWVEAWLRDPQRLVPGTIEPKLSLTDEEVYALTAYLISLRQGTSPKTTKVAHAAGGAR